MLTPSIERIERLLDQVPLFSEAAQKAQQIANQAEIELNQLVPVLEAEPSLAARVLRIANSPFYGFPRQIASIRDACVVLGQHTLRNLIMAAAVLDIFKAHATEKEYCLALSRHSVHTAVIARKLALKVRQSGDAAYTAGLLHDIGSLFTVVLLPKETVAVRQYMDTENCTLQQAEFAILKFDHACLSGAIAQRWKFPDEIAGAIISHHDPSLRHSGLADLVYVADTISSWMKLDEPVEALVAGIEPEVMSRLQLSEPGITEFLEQCPSPDDPDLDALLGG